MSSQRSLSEGTSLCDKCGTLEKVPTAWKFGAALTRDTPINGPFSLTADLQQECEDGMFTGPHLPAMRRQQAFS